MSYEIEYLPLAVADLEEIAGYLVQFYPNTAKRVMNELNQSISRLADNPGMCEEYRDDPFFRKLVVNKYLVFYSVHETSRVVEIARILRGSWNLPQYFEK